jgi:glutathione peroxidase-family protein
MMSATLSAFVLLCLATSAFSRSSFYDLSAVDIDGNDVSFEAFRGKVVLVVNVASECGFTDDHYTELQKMFNVLGQDDHFIILGFPCNQFGAQEPGSDKEIQVIEHPILDTLAFCKFKEKSVVNIHNSFSFELRNEPNKLQCLSLASLSSLVYGTF